MIGDKKATVLLVTLWILAILSLLAIGIGFRTSIELKLVGYQIDSLKAYEIAKAGVLKAINELEKDKAPNIDTIWECGITLKPDETLEGRFKGIKVGEGHFDVSLEDIQARININTAPVDILKRLSVKITNEIADNIRAWRGDQDIPPTAINRDYSDKPYSCKNAPFDIVDELLFVKDITQEIFSGGEGETGIKDFITVYGPKEFKVNVNTADQKALEALGLGESAQYIVRYRTGEDGDIMRREDNKAFTGIEELKGFLKSAEGGGMDDTALENLHLDTFCSVNSNYFSIKSIGALEARKSKIQKTIICIIKREVSAAPPRKTEIIRWFEQ